MISIVCVTLYSVYTIYIFFKIMEKKKKNEIHDSIHIL